MTDSKPNSQIPGYQVVERIPDSASFGIWIRGVQTRLDRKVLLKVLPMGNSKLDAFFEREIVETVRLEQSAGVHVDDRFGPLRVIEDGRASGVRFAVFDEAGSVPLEASHTLTDEEWFSLARLVERAHRSVGDGGGVLLPLGRGALRRLPSGDLALADLGWIVPFEETLPKHPAIGKDSGESASIGHNVRFFAASMRRLQSELPGSMPRPLLRAVELLDNHAVDMPFPDTPVVPELQSKTVPSVTLALGALIVLCVAAGLFFASGGWGAGSGSEEVAGNGQTVGPSDSADGGSSKSGGADALGTTAGNDGGVDSTGLGYSASANSGADDPGRAGSGSGKLDIEALAPIAKAIGVPIDSKRSDSVDALIERIRSSKPIEPAKLTEIAKIANANAQSFSGAIAAVLVRVRAIEHHQQRLEAWAEVEIAVRSFIESEQYAQALELLTGYELPKRLTEATPTASRVLNAAIEDDGPVGRIARAARLRLDRAEEFVRKDEQRASIGNTMVALEDEIRRSSESIVDAALEVANAAANARDYDTAAATLEFEAEVALLPADEERRQRRRSELETERQLYESASRTLDATISSVEQSLVDSLAPAAWSDALKTLASIRSDVGEFDDLSSRVDEYEGWIRTGQEAEAELGSALGALVGEAVKFDIDGENEAVRARLNSSRDGAMDVKIVGRNDERRWRWIDLTPRGMSEVLIAARVTGRADTDWALLLHLRGESERAIDAVGDRSELPWLSQARRAVARNRAAWISALLSRGRAHVDAAEFAEARALAMDAVRVDSGFGADEAVLTTFSDWIRAYYEDLGPTIAFRATERLWDATSGSIELTYTFENDEEEKDWQTGSADAVLTARRKRLEVRGDIHLIGVGDSDRVFSRDLLVQAVLTPRNRRQPNLNVVLFGRRGAPSSGILAGLGCRPPDVSRISGVGPTPVNVFGPSSAVLAGAGERIDCDTSVKIKSERNAIELGYTSEQRSAHVLVDGRGDYWSASREIPRDPADGTVGILTFGSEVYVHQIFVRGRISPRWWSAWIAAKIADDLKLP